MADVHDKKTRSFNMSRSRSKDTKPEILVRKFLFAKGFRLELGKGFAFVAHQQQEKEGWSVYNYCKLNLMMRNHKGEMGDVRDLLQ